MKTFFTIIMLVIGSTILVAQNDAPNIGVNVSQTPTDKTRTFNVSHENKDACRETLIAHWGEPVENTTGKIRWENISIEGLDTPVNIELLDGVFEINRKKRTSRFTIFKDDKHKKKLLASGTNRYMDIELKNEAGKNVINSLDRETSVKTFLEKSLSEVN